MIVPALRCAARRGAGTTKVSPPSADLEMTCAASRLSEPSPHAGVGQFPARYPEGVWAKAEGPASASGKKPPTVPAFDWRQGAMKTTDTRPHGVRNAAAAADPDVEGGKQVTVCLALAADLLIAMAKTAGGLVTMSTALLAEAAHSVADVLNELFLLAALRGSSRLPDARHPFGYGKERFFWAMLAAVGTFVTGGCFSFYQGLRTLLERGPSQERFGVAFAVLAISFCAENASLARAALQIHREGRVHGRGLVAELRYGTDPAIRTVFAEDASAVLGVVVAAVGVAAHWLTGSAVWEGCAALVIALQLALVAYRLGRRAKGLLIGEAADPALRLAAHQFLLTQPEIDVVLAVLTMRLGPDSALLAARVDLADGLDSDAVEAVSGRIRAALTARFPVFDQVFIDITDATPAGRERAAAELALLANSVCRHPGGAASRRHRASVHPGHCERTEER
jgi:cation diffusion facilitator family transporter